ncbi:NADPH-dependent 7-cyano-7-deazaguanine reductase QueF [Thalassotalea sp. M1531]|uniref:NADPH-dependent 7-cyano-7-deazaguanine reductase n=1 Tax=Thalassotalea algicola TaxID=2716224 RepID=A0A7Y0Q8B2_9GAMM|nr:NADPH-dependent 7-cyano-7-deazaguanine reductase QueF [Thalassotalea algicola]NMP33288.1 NADPH-dependent 7-cyano-7-deazaguanine reductase QueF [Thalassotalea algicola]
MAKYQNSKLLQGLTLGKATEYASNYQPELLQGVPRSLNRDDLEINQNKLPFNGEDIWYGYELSWLNQKGKPQVAIAEFSFPCSSENLIESKSFKLYLNSFNQTKFSSFDEVEALLVKDLSLTAKATVRVKLFAVDKCPVLEIAHSNAQCIDELDVEITHYDYQPTLLATSSEKSGPLVNENLVSHLLKSNCLITNQPDWASVYISYYGPQIDHEKLLQYVVSFRQHNEFHEQCVERIYCDLMHFCKPQQLTVFARYTRRGGLDINPYRSSEQSKPPALRTFRQ